MHCGMLSLSSSRLCFLSQRSSAQLRRIWRGWPLRLIFITHSPQPLQIGLSDAEERWLRKHSPDELKLELARASIKPGEGGSSNFRGVRKTESGRFQARVKSKEILVVCDVCDDEIEAARADDRATLQHRGRCTHACMIIHRRAENMSARLCLCLTNLRHAQEHGDEFHELHRGRAGRHRAGLGAVRSVRDGSRWVAPMEPLGMHEYREQPCDDLRVTCHSVTGAGRIMSTDLSAHDDHDLHAGKHSAQRKEGKPTTEDVEEDGCVSAKPRLKPKPKRKPKPGASLDADNSRSLAA